MEKIITMMYVSAAFINMISFIPQVIKLLRDKTKSDAISLQTQALWLYAVIAGWLYATFVMYDPVLIMATSVTLTGCVSITSLTLFNRFKDRLFGIKDKSLIDLFIETEFAKSLFAFRGKLLKNKFQLRYTRESLSIIGASILIIIFFSAYIT